jgi:hypothetical protein
MVGDIIAAFQVLDYMGVSISLVSEIPHAENRVNFFTDKFLHQTYLRILAFFNFIFFLNLTIICEPHNPLSQGSSSPCITLVRGSGSNYAFGSKTTSLSPAYTQLILVIN